MKKRLRSKRMVTSATKRNKTRKPISFIKREKYFITSILTFVLSGLTLWFVIIQYESPAEVKCEIDFVQRPDSLYQGQLYIWNEGEQTAEQIIIWAKKEEVFLYDTSGKFKKGRLNIFPHFTTVWPKIAPREYLDDAGIKRTFLDHQIILPKLPSSQKKDNYIIIGPNVGQNISELEKLKSSQSSIYRFKYIELGNTKNIKSYKSEVLANIQVSCDGRKIKIQLGENIRLSNIDSTRHYFPTFNEFDRYQRDANYQNFLMPPNELKKKMIKRKKNKNDDSWFLLFK